MQTVPAHTRPIDAESSCASIAHRSGMMGWAPPTPRCLDHPGPPWTSEGWSGLVHCPPAWRCTAPPLGTRCDRRRMPRCVPLSSPRFDPTACLAECAALSARREGPTRLDPDWPGWTTLDQAGPPWTTLDHTTAHSDHDQGGQKGPFWDLSQGIFSSMHSISLMCKTNE